MFFPILFVIAALASFGQHAHPTDRSEKPVSAGLPNTGNYAFPIRTASAEAQKYFNAGMAMVYGFNHDEAQRLFRRARQLDPAAPMPVWGMALSLGRHINNEPEEAREKAAWEAIAAAKKLLDGAPDHEKRYVAALAARYSPDPKADRAQLSRNYAAAMAAMYRDSPDDPDAATLYAESLMNLHPWKYWDKEGKPFETTATFVAVLEEVLRRWPDHPGANHYYIHAVEASQNPERALAAANRLGTLVPDAGHLVHMPSHVYVRTGDWKSAEDANLSAVAVDKAFVQRQPDAGLYSMMYYPHNIHFLLYARGTQGDCEGAASAAKDLVAQVTPGLEAMGMLQIFIAWDYHLSMWCPDRPVPAAPAAKYPLSTLAFAHAEGTRAAWKKDRKAAEHAMSQLRAAAKQIAPETFYEPAFTAAYSELAEASLGARLAEAGGNTAEAIAQWKKAVAAQDRLRYDEPPMWPYPVRQSLGAALLRAGRAAEAEVVLRDAIRLQRREPRVLFLLVKSLAAQGKAREAGLIEAEFRAVWKGAADPDPATL